jgi:hypothetical protein
MMNRLQPCTALTSTPDQFDFTLSKVRPAAGNGRNVKKACQEN